MDSDAIIRGIRTMCQKVYAPVLIGGLPPYNGVCLSWGAGGPREIFRNSSFYYSGTLVLNSKFEEQARAQNVLWDILKYLTQKWDYPQGESYQVFNVQMDSGPNYLGRETDGTYMYGSSLQVDFYIRR